MPEAAVLTGDAEPNALPSITLAKTKWFLPKFTPKQNRIIVPTMIQILPTLFESRQKQGMSELERLGLFMTTDMYDSICAVCHAALTRIDPKMTRDQFDGMDISTEEMIAALLPIARNAGVIPDRPVVVPDPTAPEPQPPLQSSTTPLATS